MLGWGVWQKKVLDTWFHKHKNALSTWSIAGHVKKNADATPKEALKNVALAKRRLLLGLSCDNFKTFRLT
jgi:hypothetical protein